MAWSNKYNRTYHFSFSPGTTNDDRINHDWKADVGIIERIIHTEKLDGENTCLNQYGVFSRSHAAPTIHPWANYLKEKWAWMKNDLEDIEIFGENLYAIHSIAYQDLDNHFFVFAVRQNETWLSWEEVEFYADFYEFPTVPVLGDDESPLAEDIKTSILAWASESSIFDSIDAQTEQPCTIEGVVTRNMDTFHTDDFKQNVFKYVRENHVKTDEHWTRNWKRARLNWEK